MDPLFIGLITVGLLFIAILLGVHVGVALAGVSAIGLWWITGNFTIAIKLLGATSYRAIMDYVFAVVPMFVLMGLLANISGASEDLYNSANVLFARLRGGLGIATVFANAVFAAITGTSVASAAVFSKISLPQMKRLGYDHKFALGTVAGSSVLGMLIPPSVLLIIYGILTEEAIGKLFIAGILPGIVLSIVFSVGIYLMVTMKPELGGERPTIEKIGAERYFRLLLKPWVFMILIAVVLGGMYLGFFTPTEAGATGAFGAFAVCLLKRKLTLQNLWRTLLEAGYTTSSVFFLLVSAQMYGRMLVISGLTAKTSTFVIGLHLPPLVIICLFLILFIILGAFLDSISILLVCIPLMFPVVEAFHYSLTWFGIISIVALEMGFITPPFGMVVYAMKAALMDEASLEEIFIGSFPFVLMIFFALAILVVFPWLSTWLPSLM